MIADLAELLSRETKLVEEFIACLSAEQEALKQGDIEPLAAINDHKSELVAALNAAEVGRNAALAENGYTGDRKGMLDCLAASRQDPTARRAWERLLELATEARELHGINGRLIDMRLQATHQALDALLLHPPRHSALYGRDGQSTRYSGSRIIDAA